MIDVRLRQPEGNGLSPWVRRVRTSFTVDIDIPAARATSRSDFFWLFA